jgi:hypothetical protein
MDQLRNNRRGLGQLGSRQRLALFIWGVLVLAGLGLLLGYLLMSQEAGRQAANNALSATAGSGNSNATVGAGGAIQAVPTVTGGVSSPAPSPAIPAEGLPSGGTGVPANSPTPEPGLVIDFGGSPVPTNFAGSSVPTRTQPATAASIYQGGGNAPVMQSTEKITTQPANPAPSAPITTPTEAVSSPSPSEAATAISEPTITPEPVAPTPTTTTSSEPTGTSAPMPSATSVPPTTNPPAPAPTTVQARQATATPAPTTATPAPTTAAPTFTPVPPTATSVPPTATSTVTPLPSPAATATATPSATTTKTPANTVKLNLQYRTNNPEKVTKEIRPEFKLVNTGDSAISLKDITVRYWFTSDNDQPQQFWCDYAELGCSNLSYNFGKLNDSLKQADSYLEITFGESVGELAAGSSTGEIKIRFAHQDWSDYNQENDYSFDASKNSFADWKRVTVYRNGKLIWGTEPGAK